jgi:hypothetical protein
MFSIRASRTAFEISLLALAPGAARAADDPRDGASASGCNSLGTAVFGGVTSIGLD